MGVSGTESHYSHTLQCGKHSFLPYGDSKRLKFECEIIISIQKFIDNYTLAKQEKKFCTMALQPNQTPNAMQHTLYPSCIKAQDSQYLRPIILDFHNSVLTAHCPLRPPL